jgi:hypothetical protein
MTIYTLSEYQSSWHLYRHAEISTEIACSIPLQEDALRLAFAKATEDRPSQVISVDFRGRKRVLATFEEVSVKKSP